MNMSYCRFQNTAHDLRDCLRALQNGELPELSKTEIEALEDLLHMSEELEELRDEIEEEINERIDNRWRTKAEYDNDTI
ncbi:MAG: hypothetical protein Unbinned579contig1003_2 [Prokaryotic dsDNA virus sp.]|nr:MAG: hypothetical protein Unbinned579contig1003_2 [Prokaryotic dsDNA virus sp.]